MRWGSPSKWGTLMGMADPAFRFGDNAPGAFFVDAACIDCSRCTSGAPEVFAPAEGGGHARVLRQPEGPEALRLAREALAACPVGAIGEDGARALPAPRRLLADLYALGAFTGPGGALGYLVRTPAGNVAIDPPPLGPEAARALEALGDLRFVLLTHLDDPESAWEAERYRAHFGAFVWAPEPDAGAWALAPEPEAPEALASAGLGLLAAPGHTAGSRAVLWARHGGVLFTGDALTADPAGLLEAPRYEGTWDFARQLASARALLADARWAHAAPGRAAGPLPAGYVPNARRKLAPALREPGRV